MRTARVLVVDDDSEILAAVTRMLERKGYAVLRANSADHALDIVRNAGPVDVVVSDIRMPGMQGTQLIREVSQLSRQTVSVLMTGAAELLDVPPGVSVLKKPFSMQELISAIQASLARSG